MIPFEIPDKWLDLVLRGDVIRDGVNLIWKNSGRIAGHVQETGQLARALGGANPITAVLQTASSLTANVQLEQVKSMLHTVQLLSGATLVTSLVGVGVSVAGFAIIAKRLGTMQHTLRGLEAGLGEVARLARRAELRAQVESLSTLDARLTLADQAWTRSDRQRVWEDLDRPLLEAERHWRLLTNGSYLDPSFALEEAVAAHQTTLQLAAAYTQILLALDQVRAARVYAEDVAGWHDTLLQGLTPPKVAEAHARQTAERDAVHEDDAHEVELRRARHVLETARDTQTVLEQRGAILETVETRGLPGTKVVAELREHHEHGVLILPTGMDP
jgi:hypothetical protein